jgi:hypothetical protein
MIRVIRIDKPGGLLAEHLLLEMTMEKSIRDIYPVHRPAARERELKYCKDGAEFDNGCKGVMEVNTFALSETTDHPARLCDDQGYHLDETCD